MSTEKAKIDISQLDVVTAANTGVEIELFHPATKAKLDIWVTIEGSDSDEYRKTQRAQQNRRLRTAQRGRGGMKVTAEEIEQEAFELIAVGIKGWRNMVFKGAELPYSPENAIMLVREVPWIREQIDDAQGDRSLFLKS